MTISENKVVAIDYVLTDNDGQILDQSDNGQFVYLHGAHNIIPGLEKALVGKNAGDTFDVSVSPEEGYGERNDTMLQTVSIEMFESPEHVVIGQQFHAQSPEGEHILITISHIEGDQVTIDANHPLAGQQLNFKGTVVDIRDATAEELQHGHAHGPGGHHHHD